MKWCLKKTLRHPKKKEKYKSLALKSKKVSSDEEASSSDSEDKEYAMVVRDFKKLFRRRGKFVRQPHDDKKAFRKAKKLKRGSDSDEDEDLKKDEICLMAHESNEGLGFTYHKASTSGVKTAKTSKNAIEDPGQADPFEMDSPNVSEWIRATVTADTKLKPSVQSRTNFMQITKKTSPSATIGNTKQPSALKLGQGLAN
ncbi:hypothetical protein Tco_0425343, partial [Tanacetum coccineum]